MLVVSTKHSKKAAYNVAPRPTMRPTMAGVVYARSDMEEATMLKAVFGQSVLRVVADGALQAADDAVMVAGITVSKLDANRPVL